jgi:hypothetical protein
MLFLLIYFNIIVPPKASIFPTAPFLQVCRPELCIYSLCVPAQLILLDFMKLVIYCEYCFDAKYQDGVSIRSVDDDTANREEQLWNNL